MARRNITGPLHVGVMHIDTYGRARDPEHKYQLVAEDERGVVGHMDVIVYRDEAHVDWIEVDPGQRRKGVATALYEKLYAWAKSEGVTVKHGMTTDEGEATLRALKYRLSNAV